MARIQDWLGGLYFTEPVYFSFSYVLWVLGAVIITLLVLKLKHRPTKSKFSQYKLFGQDIVWVAALFMCALSIVALAGPKVNKAMKLEQGGNIDVGFLVDTSFSTKADDIGDKSRLDAIKTAVMSFVGGGALKPGDRITLFTFGTHSIWQMPFSEDFSDFKTKLAELAHPEVYQEDIQLNTDVSNALEHVPKCIDKQENFFKKNAGYLGVSWAEHNKILFLLSDGDSNEGANLARGIKELNKKSIKVYSVGVGTGAGKNVTILAYNPDGSDKPEKITIKTALRMQSLNEIALKTGGETYIIGSKADMAGVQNFFSRAVNGNRNSLPRLVISGEGQEVWWEVLAVPGLLLLALLVVKSW